MGGFLYFVEGREQGFGAADANALGLGYALSGSIHTRNANTGPGCKSGVCVADSSRVESARVGYFPDKQTWRRVPKVAAWVGHETLPLPADLVRREIVRGHKVTLADGQQWEVPVAIEFSGPPLQFHGTLPRTMEADDDGNWQAGSVVATHAELWAIANDWWDVKIAIAEHQEQHDTLDGFESDFLTDNYLHDAAVKVLAVNYAIGPAEASLLGLFDSSSAYEVLEHLIDKPGRDKIEEALVTEKKTLDSSATSGGQPVGTKDTAQP